MTAWGARIRRPMLGRSGLLLALLTAAPARARGPLPSHHPSAESSSYSSVEIVRNGWRYSLRDQGVVRRMHERIEALIREYGAPVYLEAYSKFRFSGEVPDLQDLHPELLKAGGGVELIMPGRIPSDLWYRSLRDRKIVVSVGVRPPEQEEFALIGDITHEYFCHAPHLTIEPFALTLELFGTIYEQATPELRKLIDALGVAFFEFGMLPGPAYRASSRIVRSTPEEIRFFGAAIASSGADAEAALNPANRYRFTLEEVAKNLDGFDSTKVFMHYPVFDDIWHPYRIALELADRYRIHIPQHLRPLSF